MPGGIDIYRTKYIIFSGKSKLFLRARRRKEDKTRRFRALSARRSFFPEDFFENFKLFSGLLKLSLLFYIRGQRKQGL